MGIDIETGIWDLETAQKRHRYDPALAQYIRETFLFQSIADVGCGLGNYCKFFKESGIPIVHGYEGTQEINKIAVYDDIFSMDLTKNRWVEIGYDLVLCLEVGEHIPKNHEQGFINNLCRYVEDLLIISWAIPGQGGAGHFNEKSNECVIREFSKRGMAFDKRASLKLREAADLKWFKNTLILFERV